MGWTWSLFPPSPRRTLPSLELSAELNQGDPKERINGEYFDFTVFINHKRILSVFTDELSISTKWLSDLRKTLRRYTSSSPFVVGLAADRPIRYPRHGVPDTPYDTLTLYVGSHCLVYDLPECDREWSRGGKYLKLEQTNKALRDFLADPRLIFAAMDAGEVAARLERFHSLKMGRWADVRALAVKRSVRDKKGKVAVKDEEGRVVGKKPKELSVDDVAKILLDKRMDPVRQEWGKPEKRLNYWAYSGPPYTYKNRVHVNEINEEYVQFQTLEGFFCREIGIKYLKELKKMSSSS